MDFLFGEGQYGLRFLFAFIVVLGLIGLTAWLVRRFGSERLRASAGRGRQPRLAVIDAASVDGRRRLILIRRDNVEHLLMIGGPTDIVVEPNIVRATAAPRETATPRPPAVAVESISRPLPPAEVGNWPLAPEPVPMPPPPRAQRPAPAPVPDEAMSWPADPEPTPPPRQNRMSDPLAGLAAELTRNPPEPTVQPPLRPVRERAPTRERDIARDQEPARAPQPAAPAEAQFAASADQNLAAMAHRLEVALRRPGQAEANASPKPEPKPEPEPQVERVEQTAAPGAIEAKPARNDVNPIRAAKPAASQKSVYDNLEREMASLLGRPHEQS
jgi:flagellar protein FliO/FliZ